MQSQNDRVILVHFQGKSFNITLIQGYVPTLMAKKLKLNSSMKPTRPSKTTSPKYVLFTIGGWNAKVGSEETHRITGKFGLRVQTVARERLTEFCREHTGHSKQPTPATQGMALHMTSPHGQYLNNVDYVLDN